MKRTENKYFFISRLVLIFSLLIVLFVHAMNGDNVGNTIAEKSKMPNSSEMSMSGSVSTGIFTVK